jgi:hypothetical protein
VPRDLGLPDEGIPSAWHCQREARVAAGQTRRPCRAANGFEWRLCGGAESRDYCADGGYVYLWCCRSAHLNNWVETMSCFKRRDVKPNRRNRSMQLCADGSTEKRRSSAGHAGPCKLPEPQAPGEGRHKSPRPMGGDGQAPGQVCYTWQERPAQDTRVKRQTQTSFPQPENVRQKSTSALPRDNTAHDSIDRDSTVFSRVAVAIWPQQCVPGSHGLVPRFRLLDSRDLPLSSLLLAAFSWTPERQTSMHIPRRVLQQQFPVKAVPNLVDSGIMQLPYIQMPPWDSNRGASPGWPFPGTHSIAVVVDRPVSWPESASQAGSGEL